MGRAIGNGATTGAHSNGLIMGLVPSLLYLAKMSRRLPIVVIVAFGVVACATYVQPLMCKTVAEGSCPTSFCKWTATSVEGSGCTGVGVSRNRMVCIATAGDACVRPQEIVIQHGECAVTSVAFVEGPGPCPPNATAFEPAEGTPFCARPRR